MELFGKEISIDLDDKQQEWVFYIVTLLLILMGTHLFVVKPIVAIRKNKKIFEQEIVKHEKTSGILVASEEKYELQLAKYQEQKENYDKLSVKMENASVQNNAVLKEVVQKIVDYLGVKMISIGAIETRGEVVEEAYEKKYIPYNMEGKGRDMSNLFYYLENSEWLLSLKGNAIDLTRGGSGEDEKVRATFKLGAYYPKGGKEVNEDDKKD